MDQGGTSRRTRPEEPGPCAKWNTHRKGREGSRSSSERPMLEKIRRLLFMGGFYLVVGKNGKYVAQYS